jgi:hypothetical protein
LREDSLARTVTGEPRESLNADPILASQDPCERYQVTDIKPAGRSYMVAVKPLCNDGRGAQAGPVVEVVPDAGSWRIANVHFDGTNLKRLLCEYAMGDARVEMRPAGCK